METPTKTVSIPHIVSINGVTVDLQAMVLEYVRGTLNHLKNDLIQTKEKYSPHLSNPASAFDIAIGVVNNALQSARFEEED